MHSYARTLRYPEGEIGSGRVKIGRNKIGPWSLQRSEEAKVPHHRLKLVENRKKKPVRQGHSSPPWNNVRISKRGGGAKPINTQSKKMKEEKNRFSGSMHLPAAKKGRKIRKGETSKRSKKQGEK